MNLIEAAKDGKPIRRKGWSEWLTVQAPKEREPEFAPAYLFPDGLDPKLTPADLVATDWEVQESPSVSKADSKAALIKKLQEICKFNVVHTDSIFAEALIYFLEQQK
jgi:hypothetical protein